MTFSNVSPLSSNIFPACNHFLTAVLDNNTLHVFLLVFPFEAIKPYISIQASVASASDIRVSSKEGQKRKVFVLLPTAYTAARSVLCCQTHALTWPRCSRRSGDSVCVRSNRIAKCEKCDVGPCILGASAVQHKSEI
jgi:hypothetical protein